jgi:toxin CptA
VALALLGALGAVSVLASDMPREAAWPVAIAALASGARLAAHERRRPPRQLVWNAGGTLQVDGQRVDKHELRWHGPLAFLSWRAQDGARYRLAFWPDTLDAPARRELRLAVPPAGAAQAAPSMAP